MPGENELVTSKAKLAVRVSVIMSVVRLDDYVRPAVESVLEDLGDRDEFIVVGDGCDLTPLKAQYGRTIQYVELPERLGTPLALNAGIGVAEGRYVARLDSDDLSLPGRFDTQVAVFESRPDLVLLGGCAVLMDASGGAEKEFEVPRGAGNVARILVHRNAFVHSSVMIRSDALRSISGYDSRLLRMQDYDLFMRLAAVGEVDNLPIVLVKYRIHGAMASRTNSPYASYTRLILARRSWLSKKVGTSRIRCLSGNVLWLLAQVSRYHGWRKPRGRV